MASDLGVVNFRDVAGLRTTDGREVRPGVVFRGATPYHLTDDQVAHLRDEVGVRTRIDLRSTEEIAETPNPALAGFPETRALGLHSGSTPWGGHDPSEEPRSVHEIVGAHYLAYLEHSPESMSAIVRSVLDEAPVWVHCTAGKDRTGTALAIILAAVGVTDDEIVADYARTRDHLDEVVATLWKLPAYADRLAALPQEALTADPETMVEFLRLLRVTRGQQTSQAAARAYLAEQGWSDDDFVALEAALLNLATPPVTS